MVADLRRSTVIILLIALIGGLFVRFYALDQVEMSADEGASWAAAGAQSLSEVIHVQQGLNPGKLAAHDVLLHFWMRIFGDSLRSMRTLSVLFGTIAIGLVFLVSQETMAFETNRRPEEGAMSSASNLQWIGAVAALMLAINPKMVTRSREARMYALMMAMVLAQICFFMRASRLGGLTNYLSVGIFSALAVSSHATAALVIAAECLWLTPLLYRRWDFRKDREDDRGWNLIATFALTTLAMLPMAYGALRLAYRFARAGKWGWISRPPVIAPLLLFERGMASHTAFILCATAAVWGIFRTWRAAPRAISFLLLWMLVPPLALQLASYAVLPVFDDRYALSSLAPFLILATLGIFQLQSNRTRSIAIVAITAACAIPAIGGLRIARPRSMVAWHEAAQAMAENLNPHDYGIIAPGWTISVVRYYLRNQPQVKVESADLMKLKGAASPPALLLIRENISSDPTAAMRFLLWTAPEIIAKFQGVSLRHIDPERFATLKKAIALTNSRLACGDLPTL